MILYEEILFLKHFYNGKYVVENVVPYYEPLVAAKRRHRHLYWTNFNLPSVLSNRNGNGLIEKGKISDLEKFHNIDLSTYKGNQSKTKIGRNLVDYEAGKTIFQTAFNVIEKSKVNQLGLEF
jgi:DNA (cytosine-5)-methyltransferase 1